MAELRGPLFSVRPLESVKVQRTWLLPPPVTVLGAIARALVISGEIAPTGNSLQKISENAISQAEEIVERREGIPLCGAFLGKSENRMVVNRFVLKRALPLRSDTKGFEREDALLKEYAYSKKLYVYAFLKEKVRIDNIVRLGDTESLFTLTRAWFYEDVNIGEYGQSDVPVHDTGKAWSLLKGSYLTEVFPSSSGWSKKDYGSNLRNFILPLRIMGRNSYAHKTIEFSDDVVRGTKVSIEGKKHVIGWVE